MTGHEMQPVGAGENQCFQAIGCFNNLVGNMLDAAENVSMFSFDSLDQFFFAGRRLVQAFNNAVCRF